MLTRKNPGPSCHLALRMLLAGHTSSSQWETGVLSLEKPKKINLQILRAKLSLYVAARVKFFKQMLYLTYN